MDVILQNCPGKKIIPYFLQITKFEESVQKTQWNDIKQNRIILKNYEKNHRPSDETLFYFKKCDTNATTSNPVDYIPHHYVKKDTNTTPIHIVYDCSCRSRDQPSMNDCLMSTQPELNDFTGILICFRMNKYAIRPILRKLSSTLLLKKTTEMWRNFYGSLVLVTPTANWQYIDSEQSFLGLPRPFLFSAQLYLSTLNLTTTRKLANTNDKIYTLIMWYQVSNRKNTFYNSTASHVS
jgi:hypothetical protein